MPKNTPSRIIDNKQTRAVAFLGGSGSASGGVSDHGLLTGLADDDHAQYLRTDGARTLTGNMAVAASVTIDGIDISAHAADANAHHAQAHAITGSDHTVTGSQYQIVGLTGTNTIGLLTPASSPGANAIVKTDSSSAVTLVDATITSDLFMTGTLDFGTNTIAEDATYLQFAGSKALRFAQNMGNANWTLYTAGGYTTTGSISITGTAGDFSVGNNVILVDNSANSVGIGGTPSPAPLYWPDPQFALDINGPCRATYFIGPHALQLKNVLLLAHFDGRYPYETNYSGEPNGHMGQVATVAGGVIYRPGKFYKALQCSYATTNLITNPSFELSTSGWATDYAGVTTITNVPGGVYGSAEVIVAASGTPSNFYSPSVSVSNSTTYSASFWYRASGTITVAVREFGRATNLSSETLPTASEWTRYTKTVTTLSSGSTNIRIVFTFTNGAILEIDAAQVEASAVVTPYCDGSLGDGHAWTTPASPHASTSTRTNASLRYPVTGNISASKGTIMAWFYADAWNPNGGFIWQAGNANGEFDGYVNSAGNVVFRINGTSLTHNTGALAVKTWHHAAFTWDVAANERIVYVNGVAAGNTTTGVAPTLDATISVGNSNLTAATSNFSGYIDDFCILDRVAPAGEIKSIYESNAPVFAETSTFSFRPTPKGLIWADDEGLWMKDTSANAVFGIYGGEATKSWGGFTMAPGDLVIGNNAVGSAAILWDKSAGTFGFYGAGSATAQVEVATTGAITAGAGALALNSGGIQITAPSTSSTIGAYKFLVTGKTIESGLSAYYDNGADTYYCSVSSFSTNIGNITTGMEGIIGGGGTVTILFGLTNSLSTTNIQYTLSGGNLATWWMAGGYVGIGTAAAPTRPFQVVGGVFAGGDDTGLAGYVQLTNSTQGVSSGTGTVKLNGTTARNSVGWLKLTSGTTAIYVPYWTTVTG